MKKIAFFLFGLISYFIFFATFLYAVGFVGNFFVPKSIDHGFQGGTGSVWLVNILLLSLFGIQHSVMARQGFKKWWTKIVPKEIERSVYVLFTCIALVLLFMFWRPIPVTIWEVHNTILSDIIILLSLSGYLIVFVTTFLINHFNLFGLQQVYRNLKNRKLEDPKFVKPLFYKMVRHPLYLGFLIAFWAAPTMTIGHLLFAIATTAYMMIAIQFEEKDLVKFHGEEYKQYQKEVSMIIPLPPKQNATGEILEDTP